MFIGLILVAVGVIALLIKFDVLAGSIWGYAWPVILIILGLVFLFGRRKHGFWHGCCGWHEDEEKKR